MQERKLQIILFLNLKENVFNYFEGRLVYSKLLAKKSALFETFDSI